MDSQIRKILLVDDDPDECFLFRKILFDCSATIQLQFISHCDALLTALEAGEPDLIFMDINMPGKSGLEGLKEIKTTQRFQHLPVVMYSCSDKPSHITLSYQAGASLYLSKPASYEGLLIALKKILAMDWQNPEGITKSHLAGGRYYPFEVA